MSNNGYMITIFDETKTIKTEHYYDTNEVIIKTQELTDRDFKFTVHEVGKCIIDKS